MTNQCHIARADYHNDTLMIVLRVVAVVMLGVDCDGLLVTGEAEENRPHVCRCKTPTWDHNGIVTES